MDILKSLPELEKDYAEVIRNLDGETVMMIESDPELPKEFRSGIKIPYAHALYWQIQALRGDPRVVMWHPV